VLSCLAPNWPASAKEAEIQLWCKLRKTPADRVLTVDQLRSGELRLERAPDVSFAVEVQRASKPGDFCRVLVTERHPPESDPYRLKVEMAPPPRGVIHRFNPKTGTVRHTFFHDDAAPAEIGRYQVHLTTRARLFDEAVCLPEPLVVTIPRVAP
jgi:hypothetical protein